MNTVEERIKIIEDRNSKVELDKAWETSWTRRFFLAVFTYLAIGIYMWAIEISRPWLNALVPTAGFMISTLTMPFLKKRWLTSKSVKK